MLSNTCSHTACDDETVYTGDWIMLFKHQCGSGGVVVASRFRQVVSYCFSLTVVETKPQFWHKIPASLPAASATGVVAPDLQVSWSIETLQ